MRLIQSLQHWRYSPKNLAGHRPLVLFPRLSQALRQNAAQELGFIFLSYLSSPLILRDATPFNDSPNHRSPRLASSASSARSRRSSKNADDWPMKSPMAVRNFRAPVAAPSVAVGRTIEHAGSFRLRNTVGSGMMRLVWNSSPPSGDEFRSGNTSIESFGSVKAGALPALSLQV